MDDFEDIDNINFRLQESYALFKSEDNFLNRKALAESFVEVCSIFANMGDLCNFESNFNKIRDLKIFDLTPDICNKLSVFFPILTSNAHDKIFSKPDLLDDVFFMMRELVLTKPSEFYSNLLLAIHPFRSVWKGFKEFCRWWGFPNFCDNDFVTTVTDEPDIDSCCLAESSLIAFTQRVMNTKFKEDLARLTMLFIEYSQNHKFTIFSNLYIARLFLKIGFGFNLVQRVLRPFIIENHNNPFAWYYFSKTYSNSRFIDKYSCLLMSLNCAGNFHGDLVPGIFLDIAMVLKYNGKLCNAKYYYEKYFELKKNNDSVVSEHLKQVLNEDWFKSTESKPDSQEFDYIGNCRSILRSINDADRDVWVSLYRFARDKNRESVDWNS